MKKVIGKTEAERERELKFSFVKVEDVGDYFYWICYSCKVCFFAGDTIIAKTDYEGKKDGYACPLFRTTFFNKKPCRERIYCGDETSFNRFFKLAPTS